MNISLHSIWSIMDGETESLGDWLRAIESRIPSPGELPPIPRAVIRDGVSVIPIHGRIMRDVSPEIQSLFSVHDIRNLGEDLDAAISDRKVKAIALDVQSSGGLASAGEEAAEMIQEARARKPIMAWTPDRMASAAYQIALPAHGIFASPFASGIGSVGSMAVIVNRSGSFKAQGVEPRVLRSGLFKGQGDDGEISQEAIDFVQAKVDRHGQVFRDAVTKYRPSVTTGDMQGQWYGGQEALSRGFITGTARNLEKALAVFTNRL